MSEQAFTSWAVIRGMPDATISELLQYAASPEEMELAEETMDPPPPVYSLDSIVEMNETDPTDSNTENAGLIAVGGCINGDPIVIDVTNDVGSVWYVNHEVMHEGNVRESAIRVAGSLKELFDGLTKKGFPFDYFEAIERLNK